MSIRRSTNRWTLLWTATLTALLVLSLNAAVVRADAPDLGFESFDATVLDADHKPVTQAGAHPFDAASRFTLKEKVGYAAFAHLNDTIVDLPAGLVGNATAVQQCSPDDFQGVTDARCPPSSQVGIAVANAIVNTSRPLFNLVPQDGAAAQFGFKVEGVPIVLTASLRPDDYGLRITSKHAVSEFAFDYVSVMFWGVPADARHNPLRSEKFDQVCVVDATDPAVSDQCGSTGGVPSNTQVTALLSNPADCSAGPFVTTISGNSWENPEVFGTASVVSHDDAVPFNPVGVTGCDRLSFRPTMSVQPTTSSPDAPTGLSVKLSFPTEGLLSPTGVAEPPLRKAVVTLPEGMTVNPASADGLQACTDSAIGFGTDQKVSCPDGSKLGTVTASTPVLDEPVSGAVYLRPQASADPESGEMFRIVMILRNEQRGLLFKLPGSIRADKATGRLVTTFDNNPQQPVSELTLQFKSGSRAPLVTPASCGVKSVDAELTSWGRQVVTRQDSFTVPCTAGLGGFAPTLTAGVVNPRGGAFSPFALNITKPDGNSDINGLRMSLPTGLLANLKGVVGQQVGSVKAFAGPGSNPFMLPGKVFLEGPYGDAPFSLKVVVPAKAGPFDLGEVVVKQKIYVDPIDAHVTVVSDPIPTIVAGVPVRLQRLEVNVDRPGFIVNPTSCAAKTIAGTLSSTAAQTVQLTNRFQVAGCSALALKPQLGLTLSGKGQNKDGGHPAVSATLTQPAGQANLKRVRVALPLSLALDPDNAASDDLCSFVESSKPDPRCPASSIVGKATAVSPILNEPLTGPVYFAKNERKDPKSGRSIKTTPKLVIPLTGENGVKLTLTGASTVTNDQLVTTFDNIPDARVLSFRMDITGGKKGILVVSGDKADICKTTQIADQQIDGQNGKAADADVSIQTPSCPTKIISKKVGKKSVALKIGGLAAGKVTVTGRGIKKTTKTITKSTVATITAKRTGKSKPGAFKVKFTKAKAAAAR